MTRIARDFGNVPAVIESSLGAENAEARLHEMIGGQGRVAGAAGFDTRVDLLFPALEDQPVVSGLWAQIDRWVNEGGAWAKDPLRDRAKTQ